MADEPHETSDPDIQPGSDYFAPADPVVAEGLDHPSNAETLYLEESSAYRPVSTGDIFAGVTVPGAAERQTDEALAMVVAHPSAMRNGATLHPTVRAAPVLPIGGLSKTKWAKTHFNVFPLPLLSPTVAAADFKIERLGWGAALDLAAPTATESLKVENRVACLSPDGVHFLLQRLVHADTRVAVRLDTLAVTFEPKILELELLEDWNERLISPLNVPDAELERALLEHAKSFDEFMNQVPVGHDTTPRKMLERRAEVGGTSLAPQARRLVIEEIKRRVA